MAAPVDFIYAKLKQYKRKFYKNLLLRGAIISSSALVSAYVLMNLLEYWGHFTTSIRATMLFSFVALTLAALGIWVIKPIFYLLNEKKQLSDQTAAEQIGKFFPQVKDKLLNILQLQQQAQANPLAKASIGKKAATMQEVEFVEAIQYKENRRYVRFLIIPLLIFGLILAYSPELFTKSTKRILQYDKTFAPEAPFSFFLLNKNLRTFKNENFEVSLKMKGSALPAEVYLLTSNGRKVKMEKVNANEFRFEFQKVQQAFDFYFEALDFQSQTFKLEIAERPNLNNFSTYLVYPRYLGKEAERIENTGNLVVPEGTEIVWTFQTHQAEKLNLSFEGDSTEYAAQVQENNAFKFSKKIRKSANYKVKLKNKFSANKEDIQYYLNVIVDEYPSVSLNQFQDSVLYDFLLVGGNAVDDYGVQTLLFKYRLLKDSSNQNATYQSIKLAVNPNTTSQDYFHQLNIKDLGIKQGEKIEYFVEVWDNDGVNGSKSGRSPKFEFSVPSKKEFKEEIAKSSQNTENQIDKAKEKAEDLQKDLKDLQDKLKGKKKLSWQDQKAAEELLKKHEELKKELENISKENQLLQEKQERFEEKKDEKLAEKAKELQELMEQLLDDETKKLFEELDKILQENMQDSEKMQELLEKIEKRETNLEKELDRTLEIFKKMKFDQKLKDISQDLKELAKEQEKLAQETQESKEEALDEMKEKQEQLNQKFEDVKKEMEELDEINKSLKNKKDLEDFNEQEQNIDKEQKTSSEQLEQKNQKKASQSQKKASEEMRKMQQKMEDMQEKQDMQEMQENYDDLRKIMENLMTLSFEQEEVMTEFRKVSQKDPKYITLSQRQLKIKDDFEIVEDSLRALAERVTQIKSFVTQEVVNVNDYMGQSVDAIKKRRSDVASSKQQFTMTSMNNLALLLNDILQQMQESMGSGMAGEQMANKKGNSPSLSQMQKALNQKIEDLKKSGKTGKSLSEELAKLAAEQEAIRRALEKQGKEKGKKDGGEDGGGGNLSKMIKEMQKTEEDIVNKRLTQELIQRQQQILTRLLESEKSDKERDTDKEREAQTAKENKRVAPPHLEKYLKTKQQQIELLKTIPASLNPYYKKAVNDYFKKIK